MPFYESFEFGTLLLDVNRRSTDQHTCACPIDMIGYGVVANIIASHWQGFLFAIARGSIPRIRIFFFVLVPIFALVSFMCPRLTCTRTLWTVWMCLFHYGLRREYYFA